MSAYRFALRPRWMLSHAAVVTLVVVMVGLGLWQLRRLDERRAVNDLVESRRDLPVEDITAVLDPGMRAGGAEQATYRRVVATGTYDVANQVLVRSRSLGGRPGVWVLTPLVLDDGEALVVNRGFVAVSGVPEGLPADAAPPEGAVEAEGLLRASQERDRYGPTDPAEGRLDDLARADLGRLQRQVPYDLYAVYLDLTRQSPAPADLPVLLPEPTLDDGPHLGYAAQWFIFSAIGAIGYPLILRRRARAGAASSGPSDGDGSGDGSGNGSGDGDVRDRSGGSWSRHGEPAAPGTGR